MARPKPGDFSEFDGAGVMPSGVFPKGADSLTDADRLRLGYITGVEDDPSSRPEPFHFVGNMQTLAETANRAALVAEAEKRRQKNLKHEGSDRYKNWPS